MTEFVPPWKTRHATPVAKPADVGPKHTPQLRQIVHRDHPEAFTLTTEQLAARMQDSTLFRRERFIQEYIKDFNAKRAAIRIGCSQATAGQQGYGILNEPYVQRRLLEVLAEIEEDSLVTRNDVIAGLLKEAHTAESDAARVAAWGKLAKIKGMEIDVVQGQLNHIHRVMEVPGVGKIGDWEEAAEVSQQALKEDVRK